MNRCHYRLWPMNLIDKYDVNRISDSHKLLNTNYKCRLRMSFLWYILIGMAAGFIAGKIMRGGGFGIIVNLIVGIVGGVLGGWIFGLLGISSSGIIGGLITAVVGAVVLLWITGLISRRMS